MAKAGQVIGAAALIAFFSIPVFRSGGRTHLTCFQWLINHTIFGPPVEYVPEEDYMRELEGLPVSGVREKDIPQIMAFHQISEESARKLAITRKLC